MMRSSFLRRNRHMLIVGVLLSVLLAVPSGVATDSQQRSVLATVRGKIQRQQQSRLYPAPNVRVTLIPRSASSRALLIYTGNDGMFYFRNVPAGTYRFEVWLTRVKPATTRDVTVQPGRPYVDIAPITI